MWSQKKRLLGQIIENPCECSEFWIFMKLADNNDMDKILDEFDYVSDRTNNGKVMSL